MTRFASAALALAVASVLACAVLALPPDLEARVAAPFFAAAERLAWLALRVCAALRAAADLDLAVGFDFDLAVVFFDVPPEPLLRWLLRRCWAIALLVRWLAPRGTIAL